MIISLANYLAHSLQTLCSGDHPPLAQSVFGPVARWPLAGDQLFVDFDLSEAGTPAGTNVRVVAAGPIRAGDTVTRLA